MSLTPEELNARCTYATPDEIKYMREKMANKLQKRASVVMIGAGPGVLLFPLLEKSIARTWNIYVIDLITCDYAKEHFKQGDANVVEASQYITWFENLDSYHVGNAWNLEPIDLLIVDGDHSDYGVRRDMKAWLPHIADGGYVFFHDYEYTGTQWEDQNLENVKLAVDEVMKTSTWKQVAKPGCSVVFKRVK